MSGGLAEEPSTFALAFPWRHHAVPRLPLAGDQRLPLVQHPHALVDPIVGQQGAAVVPAALLVQNLASLPLLGRLTRLRGPR